MSDVVALIGNPRPGTRTRTLAEAAAAGIVSALAAAGRPALDGGRVLELAQISAVSFGPGPAQPSAAVDDPHALVRQARLLVVAVPVAIAAAEAHRQVAAALEALLAELGATVPAPPLAVLEPALADPAQLATRWATDHASALTDALGASRR